MKSQREFVAVTLIALISIALVIAVYATLLAQFQGAEVVVGSLTTGNVYYSLTDSNVDTDFLATVSPSGPSTSWYAKLNTTGGEYTGPVTVSWQLQKYSGTWDNMGAPVVSTPFTLTLGSDTIYCSSDGTWTAVGQNQDWSILITDSGSYRVEATITTLG